MDGGLVMARPTFAERCYAESTRDVIFLFQRRKWNLHGLPDGYHTYDGGVYAGGEDPEGDDYDHPERNVLISLETIYGEGWEFGDWDHPCVTSEWITESVWLSREEATAYGNAKSYNFTDGWRVYGVCANGELAELIKGT